MFKQPHPPEPLSNPADTANAICLFLKDFCGEAWIKLYRMEDQLNRLDKHLEALDLELQDIKYRIDQLESR